jgi:hypothetical protein
MYDELFRNEVLYPGFKFGSIKRRFVGDRSRRSQPQPLGPRQCTCAEISFDEIDRRPKRVTNDEPVSFHGRLARLPGGTFFCRFPNSGVSRV